MGRFVSDPDYTLRWPPAIFEEELRRLLRSAGVGTVAFEFDREVGLLLGQAFASTVPVEDFSKVSNILLWLPHQPPPGELSAWLAELADDAENLPMVDRPRPYWSQKGSACGERREDSWEVIVHRVRELIQELLEDHYFARTLGYDCVDDRQTRRSSPVAELEWRVGKAVLWDKPDGEWSEDDLCDFIEVFHDLAARPRLGDDHEFADCGFHPTRFSVKSGQALYRWRVNQLLGGTTLDLRIADAGEDAGRMVRVAPDGMTQLIDEALASSVGPTHGDVAHAIAVFRARGSARQDRRSAVVALAGVLEQRRGLIKEELLGQDERALFEIANKFDLRHRKADQRPDYDEAYLEWIFFWYLATVNLTNHLLARQESSGKP